MDILINIGMILFWFSVVVVCGTVYVWVIIVSMRKGWLGETSSKVVYFATFVIIAAMVFKLKVV